MDVDVKEASDDSRSEYVAPRTDAERAVAQLWREVLGRDQVGVLDRFLDLGGNSLQAMQLANRVRERLGIALTTRDVLIDTTIATVARKVEEVDKIDVEMISLP